MTKGQLKKMHHMARRLHSHICLSHSGGSKYVLQGLFLRGASAVILADVMITLACLSAVPKPLPPRRFHHLYKPSYLMSCGMSASS